VRRLGGDGPAAAEIEWDVADGEGGGEAGADIDWGADEGADTDWSGGGGGDGGGDGGGAGNAVAGALPAGGAAVELTSLAERNLLVNDLVELDAFLQVRQTEMLDRGSAALLAAAPVAVSGVDADLLRRAAAAVAAALETINGAETRKLIMLATSACYVQRLAQVTAAKRSGSDAMLRRAGALDEQSAERVAELAELGPRLDELLEQTRAQKGAIEGALAAVFGRAVNVVGDINTLLRAGGKANKK
jgi:hypothetical protein